VLKTMVVSLAKGLPGIPAGRRAWRGHDRGDSARRRLASPPRALRGVAQPALCPEAIDARDVERNDHSASLIDRLLGFVPASRIRRCDEAGH